MNSTPMHMSQTVEPSSGRNFGPSASDIANRILKREREDKKLRTKKRNEIAENVTIQWLDECDSYVSFIIALYRCIELLNACIFI